MGETERSLLSDKPIPGPERLVFALDVPSAAEASRWVDALGDAVHFYKLGLELFMAGGYFELLDDLIRRGKQVFVDLKFFDVPETVAAAVRQLRNRGARFATVHGNDGMIAAACREKGDLKVLAVTALTSLDQGDLRDLGFRDESARVEAWRQKVESWPEMRDAAPNPGHLAFVELARMGKLTAMITQNIDGLHQRSGLKASRILELHGTTVEAVCLSCSRRIPMDEAVDRIKAGEQAPKCRGCGGILKTATVSFGQAMPQDVMREAEAAALSCEVFLAVPRNTGRSARSSLPGLFKSCGTE